MKTNSRFIIFSVIILGLCSQNAPAQKILAGPEVARSVFFFESKPIREMRIVLPGEHEKEQWAVPNRFKYLNSHSTVSTAPADKPVLQKTTGTRASRGPLLNFEGVGNMSGGFPADPNGDVGVNHYVQMVNSAFAIWDKGGNILYGPVDYQTIWASFPGPWNTYMWCDPVIKYDHMADRWVMLSMSFDFDDWYTMIAVSSSPDPAGSYYCYAYYFSECNDYPKLSVWPDGYYIAHNIWDYDEDIFLFTHYSVVDREAMISGATMANMISFQIQDPGEGLFFPMPADSRGSLVPTDSACYFVNLGREVPDNPWHLYLDVYAFDTDWDIPANSSFGQVARFDIGTYEPVINFGGVGSPQLGSNVNVMTIPLLMMYPLTYRMIGGHETMVCCQTMWDGDLHYVKWYELRKENAGWYIYQSGNYAPGDANYFFPSISMNANGDIALGYSACSVTMYPSIRFTGRRAEDTLGLMTFQELDLYKGLNYANSFQAGYDQNRWGDYSSMMVDPSDDTTFWYTNMYTKAVTTPGNWATRIFSIDLSEDTATPYAFAGNDTVAPNIVFFETQGEAENYSSIVWATSGDGNFVTNNAEHVTYLRGPGDIDSGQVTLTMHLTGYYTGTEASDGMVLYLKDTLTELRELHSDGMNLEIFPNPARDLVTVKAACHGGETVILKMTAADGRHLFTGSFPVKDNGFEKQLDVSFLDEGNYLITIQTGNQQVTEKLLVQ